MSIEYDRSLLSKYFNAIVVYYFFFLVFYDGGEIESFGLLYLLLVLPVIAFCSLGVAYALVHQRFYSFEKSSLFVLLFTLSSCALSILRFDFIGAASVAILGLTILTILHHKLQYNIKLLNSLYIIGIFFSVPMYYLGLSPYGFLPSMGNAEHNIEILAGRVSIFPGVASSIQVSFLILLVNIFYGPKFWRWVLIALALYYIYFGVSRLIILAIILLFFIFALTKVFGFKGGRLYSDVLPLFLITSLILLLFNIGFLLSPLLTFDFISMYFFRDLTDADDILKDVARLDLWASHVNIFLNNPLGISSSEHISIAAQMDYDNLGSESFLTRVFVAHGIAGLFFIFFVYSVMRKAVVDGNLFRYMISFSILLVGMFYGSSFNAYNFVFLMLISSLVYQYKK